MIGLKLLPKQAVMPLTANKMRTLCRRARMRVTSYYYNGSRNSILTKIHVEKESLSENSVKILFSRGRNIKLYWVSGGRTARGRPTIQQPNFDQSTAQHSSCNLLPYLVGCHFKTPWYILLVDSYFMLPIPKWYY